MRNKYQIQIDNRETTPFESSEEAWFWYCLCEQLGHERAHKGDSHIARPCESSDIIIAVKKLIHKGAINPEHINILKQYGYEQAPPHPHFGATQRICKLWHEAMHFLDTILRQKGIVRLF